MRKMRAADYFRNADSRWWGLFHVHDVFIWRAKIKAQGLINHALSMLDTFSGNFRLAGPQKDYEPTCSAGKDAAAPISTPNEV